MANCQTERDVQILRKVSLKVLEFQRKKKQTHQVSSEKKSQNSGKKLSFAFLSGPLSTS